MSPVRSVESLEELVAITGDHPVVRFDVGAGFVPPGFAVTVDGEVATVFPRRSDHGIPGASTIGTPVALDRLFGDDRIREWFEDNRFHHLSMPREHAEVVLARMPLGERGGDWDWMWTTADPPSAPGEDRVEELSESDQPELVTFLARANPRTHGQPFARDGQRWVGIRDATGRVVACGAAEPSGAGTPTLAGIAVEPGLRRCGLGAAVTAALTRAAVRSAGACALGMFADNDDARRVYRRLGFTTGMRWRSRWVERVAEPASTV